MPPGNPEKVVYKSGSHPGPHSEPPTEGKGWPGTMKSDSEAPQTKGRLEEKGELEEEADRAGGPERGGILNPAGRDGTEVWIRKLLGRPPGKRGCQRNYKQSRVQQGLHMMA